MRLKLFFLFVFLTVQMTSSAQFAYYDSIKNLIQQRTGQQKLDQIILYCDQSRNIPPDSFNKYLELYSSLIKGHDNTYYKLYERFFKQIQFVKAAKYDAALQLLNEPIDSVQLTVKELQVLHKIQIARSSVLIRKTEFMEAIAQCLKTMRSAAQVKDSAALMQAWLICGWANMESQNTREALNYFYKVIRQNTSSTYSYIKTSAYSNMAGCFGQLNKLDSVEYCLNLGEQLANQYHQYFNQIAFLNFRNNLYTLQNNTQGVEANCKKILELRKLIGDPFYYVADLVEVAAFYASQKQGDKGLAYSQEAMQVAQQYGLRAKLPSVYKSFYFNYLELGDFKAAASVLKKYADLQDSLYKEASAEELADLQVKYNLSENERVIQQQQFALSRKNWMIGGVAAFLFLFAVLAFLAFRNLKRKKEIELKEKLMQEQHHSTQAIIEAEERERNRIAADLHDGVGQLITAAKFNLEGIEHKLVQLSPEDKIIFEKAKSLVEQSGKDIRAVSHNIMPNVLLKSGLGAAVKDFIDKIDNRHLKVNLTTKGLNQSLDKNIEIILYRVIQECVNNVIKHAKANTLDISIYNEQAEIDVLIEDNGIGFEKKLLSEAKGIGLKNLESRVQFLKGYFDIESTPHQGTLVVIKIPKTEQK